MVAVLVKVVFAVFLLSGGPQVDTLTSRDPVTQEECEAKIIMDAPVLVEAFKAHGADVRLEGKCVPVGQEV